MMHSLLFTTTDLGESAVVGIATLVAVAYLWFSGFMREALALLLSLAAASALIAILKLAFLTCTLQQTHIISPSGHAALASAVFGMYALLIGAQFRGVRHYIPLGVAALLILAIAVTRVVLGFHTTQEVILGLCVGSGVDFALWWWLFRRKPIGRLEARTLLLVTLATVLLFHGVKVPSEDIIRVIAAHFRHNGKACTV